MTPEQREAMRKRAEEVRQWRLSVSMDKYKAFRRMYEDAGVKIYAFKLPPTLEMPDAEYEYIWNVAETLGANHLMLPLVYGEAPELTAQYVKAFQKVWAHRKELA